MFRTKIWSWFKQTSSTTIYFYLSFNKISLSSVCNVCVHIYIQIITHCCWLFLALQVMSIQSVSWSVESGRGFRGPVFSPSLVASSLVYTKVLFPGRVGEAWWLGPAVGSPQESEASKLGLRLICIIPALGILRAASFSRLSVACLARSLDRTLARTMISDYHWISWALMSLLTKWRFGRHESLFQEMSCLPFCDSSVNVSHEKTTEYVSKKKNSFAF